MHQWKANKYMMLFADCMIVNGNQRSLIAAQITYNNNMAVLLLLLNTNVSYELKDEKPKQ